jgi:uncharacterized protein YbaR (Trm112 family)
MLSLNQDTLKLLRCPRSAQPLKVLSEGEWSTLSARLESLEVSTAFGAQITMEGGAICDDETPDLASYVYPISHGLLYLMPNDAVALNAPSQAPALEPEAEVEGDEEQSS